MDSPCPIARGVATFGDAWSLLILRDALAGVSRFDDFRRGLGIAPTVLTKRLASLTQEGLLEKVRYQDHPPRDEYRLTEAGRDLLPILFMIAGWSRKHRSEGALVRYLDAVSGRDIEPVAIDRGTGAEIGSRAFRVVVPGSTAEKP
ncbi:helix-turn-helix domain-containing protein [Caulobacter sp. BP25]|uniref:winged helix-turn-helix transcriptional regulator n=1 Tax=Caulobacter sp. BP25 TaxID=2048900 RepID=UPI000C12B0AF|nr:helix-turn-helix domain-containing protein [Caulobacter sp. BP25]PHY17573.1 transcriptional regulator [Caulobacter sp. BP25]